jgi:hypothetical protein
MGRAQPPQLILRWPQCWPWFPLLALGAFASLKAGGPALYTALLLLTLCISLSQPPQGRKAEKQPKTITSSNNHNQAI